MSHCEEVHWWYCRFSYMTVPLPAKYGHSARRFRYSVICEDQYLKITLDSVIWCAYPFSSPVSVRNTFKGPIYGGLKEEQRDG